MANILSDEKLFQLCQIYGARLLEARKKFLGLLPEVQRRHLYERKGFSSIFEFAAKLAGVSAEQVRNVLNLERKFENVPVLKKLLVNGEVSVNKLVRIASVVNPANAGYWAAQARNLPQKTLETLVRDEKILSGQAAELRAQPASQQEDINVKLPADVAARLEALREKGIDIGKLLTEFLDNHEKELAEEKLRVAQEQEKPAPSRYVPQKIRRLINEEFGNKCAIPHCQKPSAELHHVRGFALARSHDPRFLVPLCHEHHQLAHGMDKNYWKHFNKKFAFNTS